MCLRLGIDDPEQWLEDCPDRVYATWEAYYGLEPWGGERELLARLLATMRCLLSSKYEEDKVAKVLENVDRLAAAYMPGEWVDQPEQVTEEEALAAVQRQLEARG